MYASDTAHPSPALGEKLARLYTLSPDRTIDLSFRAPYLDLLKAFGNPHKKLPPVIHVAGTNGKGSIIATLRSILEAGGYSVHTYTSPHLCRFNERIVLAGEMIKDDLLESLIDEALALNKNNTLTFFEITTAIAFAAFSRIPADILLLEVGLGGRLDCTNVIENPLVTIIGSIGYDHTEYLGETLPQIAFEKGGIIKPACPCVIGAQRNDSENNAALKTLMEIAAQKGATLARHGAEWFTQEQGDLFKFVYKDVETFLPRPNLCGSHQIANAGAAIAALEIIKSQFPVSRAAMEKGLRNIQWLARLQTLTKDFGLPEGWEVWLDGGHNEDAAQVLAAQAAEWKKQDNKNLHIVLGMMNHKQPGDFVQPLAPYMSSLSLVNIPGEPKSHSASELAQHLPPLSPATVFNDFTDAITHITQHNPPDRILITGSLYLAGHVLKTCRIQP